MLGDCDLALRLGWIYLIHHCVLVESYTIITGREEKVEVNAFERMSRQESLLEWLPVL